MKKSTNAGNEVKEKFICTKKFIFLKIKKNCLKDSLQLHIEWLQWDFLPNKCLSTYFGYNEILS